MPSETRPLPAAIVSRNVSQRGEDVAGGGEQHERDSGAQNQAARPGAVRTTAGSGETVALDVHRAQIFLACVRWNSPSGRNISTTAMTM